MARKRILVTRPIHEEHMRALGQTYQLDVHEGPYPMPRESLLAGLPGAAGLLCLPYDNINREAIEAGPDLETIATYSVGFDHIDLRCAAEHDITVGHTPDALTGATADMAIGLMLAIMRRIPEGDRLVREGRWDSVLGPEEFLGRGAQGSTIGIVGMGRIGRAVMDRAYAMEMQIIYNGRSGLTVTEEKRLGATRLPLDELLPECDVVSLHVPYTPKTHMMIGAGQLALMKRDAFLVNTSRGRVVDQAALAEALKSGGIAGAALDVFEDEPGPQKELAGLPNVVMTPHTASATFEARQSMAMITAENLRRGLAGKRPLCEA